MRSTPEASQSSPILSAQPRLPPLPPSQASLFSSEHPRNLPYTRVGSGIRGPSVGGSVPNSSCSSSFSVPSHSGCHTFLRHQSNDMSNSMDCTPVVNDSREESGLQSRPSSRMCLGECGTGLRKRRCLSLACDSSESFTPQKSFDSPMRVKRDPE